MWQIILIESKGRLLVYKTHAIIKFDMLWRRSLCAWLRTKTHYKSESVSLSALCDSDLCTIALQSPLLMEFSRQEYWKVKVKVLQLCPTLCYLVGYTVHGILQARILEWVAFPFSRDLPNSGTEPRSPALQADFFTSWATREAHFIVTGIP